MAKLQPVRGTHDLLPKDSRRHRYVIEVFCDVAERFVFGEISTPIFEFTEVFKRTLGETSDVVNKEMYSFTDRGGEEVTLRPEYTAGIARAFISGGLAQSLPLKFYGHGPMFRYERPQKGRQRQFHQLDAEILGVAEPLADIEVIALGAQLLEDLGIAEVTELELNTLGDPESRAAYRDALVTYFSGFRDKLSDDSVLRLERNPPRILDSKDQGDRRIIEGAPDMGDYLNDHSKDFFAAVCGGLDSLGIAYRLNPRLVRGLDYYTHTAFEFTTQALGAQGAVVAGGRYDGLIEAMGGQPTPGIGWAAGIERLAMLVGDVAAAKRPIAVIPVGDEAADDALELTHRLRRDGYTVDLGYRGNLQKRMKRANKLGASAALILGEDERAQGAVTLRDLDTGEQVLIPLPELTDRLSAYR
ncbi:MAG: histidine--tRNA ligase [Pseudomonadota bacterium]|nr:histidine--tRNA ligase [Pseudomonadota bacterium]